MPGPCCLGQSQVCDGAADCLTGRNEEDCTIIAPSLNTTSPCYNNLYLRHNIALVRLNRDNEDHCTTGTWAGSSLTGNVVRGLMRLVCKCACPTTSPGYTTSCPASSAPAPPAWSVPCCSATVECAPSSWVCVPVFPPASDHGYLSVWREEEQSCLPLAVTSNTSCSGLGRLVLQSCLGVKQTSVVNTIQLTYYQLSI